MPKVKTHSGAKKRMKLTGTGKVKTFQANTSHLMRNKSKKSKRRHRGSVVAHPSEQSRLKALLGIF
ncbi:MAG: 50S ribosomal protein L35 [Saprospiraceae bacterium]|nr:50S ribosomal protein L35 [Candidatus Vicinibacter affinis]MBP6174135.1 50S ribosomal protein L35 [Saprospiraceae bacterium]MBK6572307.1 50S ribosomal protein L35 [Candidatus Vicinibacter affinis]MBK6824284.1 50S ribosomal protein L35 [Candidatus Vicinibacter affinis]MBK7303895.1 50S ribosomal protein L35 [Candidatus Vicinibacter affinis]